MSWGLRNALCSLAYSVLNKIQQFKNHTFCSLTLAAIVTKDTAFAPVSQVTHTQIKSQLFFLVLKTVTDEFIYFKIQTVGVFNKQRDNYVSRSKVKVVWVWTASLALFIMYHRGKITTVFYFNRNIIRKLFSTTLKLFTTHLRSKSESVLTWVVCPGVRLSWGPSVCKKKNTERLILIRHYWVSAPNVSWWCIWKRPQKACMVRWPCIKVKVTGAVNVVSKTADFNNFSIFSQVIESGDLSYVCGI